LNLLWKKPATDTIKINIDASFLINIVLQVGASIKFRGDNGEFKVAKMCRKPWWFEVWAGAMGLLTTLQWPQSFNLRLIMFEVDAQVMAHNIKSNKEDLCMCMESLFLNVDQFSYQRLLLF